MTFDRKLEYQFGLFLVGQEVALSEEALRALPKHFEPRTRFPDPVVVEQLVHNGAQMVRVPAVTWGAGGIWRMTFSGGRLDVTADALQFESAAERALSLEAARSRLVLGLTRVAKTLADGGLAVHRLVAVLHGEASAVSNERDALVAAADYCFADWVRTGTRDGEVMDLGARIDRGGTLDLASAGAVPVHRIENIGTVLSYVNTTPIRVSRVALEVNTSPVRGIEPLPLECFEPFFAQACAWMDGRVKELSQ